MDKITIARMIDHTLLKADASESDIKKLCEEALEYKFWSVCINSSFVSYASKILKGSDTKVCTVVGFPLGASISEVKAKEAQLAINLGASEIDMVINVGLLKDKKFNELKKDIEEVRKATSQKLLKVIIETCLLTDEEKTTVCKIAKEAKADFVKTSTGFSTGGATEGDILLMRNTVGTDMGVKASGGVRSISDLIKLHKAGANRFGTSASISILNGLVSSSNY